MTQADPFSTAAQTGPVVRCLGNDRLIVAIPLRVEQQEIPPQYLNGKPAGTKSDVLVADVIAIDGAPVMFGGDPTKGVPDTMGPIMPGTPMREFRFYQTTLVSQLRGHIGRGPVIGRLLMSQTKAGLPNWKLVDPRDGDKMMALGPYQAYASGQFQSAPAPAASAPQSAPPATPVAQAAPTTYAPQAVAQPVQQAAPAMPAAPTSAPDWTLAVPPPNGFEPAQWQSFAPHQREQLLALNGVQRPVGV